MMPGQEKMVMEFYQKNPQALASLKGTVYEEKIINVIKTKAKANKKELTQDEAEKVLKKHQKHEHDHNYEHSHDDSKEKKAKATTAKKSSTPATKKKKVSKK
jgi:trigger factor